MPEQYAPPTAREVTAAFAFGTQRATIKTQRGDIVIELYGDRVPLTVANFIKLAKAGLYKVSAFHRVIRNPQFWIIEAGDPEGNGTGSPDYTLKLEIVPQLKHEPGAIAMARANLNDSAASQFYITLNHMPHLDGLSTVFGKVVKGLEVAQQIRPGDMIVDVIVEPVTF